MVGRAQKSHGARSGLYGGCSNGVSPIHFPNRFRHTVQISPHAIYGLFQPRKGSYEAPPEACGKRSAASFRKVGGAL
jgi:hypothetical protein